MKKVFFITILLAIATMSFSQNSIPADLPQKVSENNRWDLNRYVWSHTNYKTGKNDKLVIDFDAIDNWSGIGSYVAISPDGKYFAYNTEKGTGLRFPSPDSLIVQSTTNSWKKAFPLVNSGFFSANSKEYIFQDKETLYFLPLGKGEPSTATGILSYKPSAKDVNEWFAYKLKGSEAKLVLRNLKTGKEKSFTSVSDYSFDVSNKWLVLQRTEAKGLQLYNLITGKELQLSSGVSYLISKTGKTIVIKSSQGKLLFTDLTTDKETVIFQTDSNARVIKEFKLDGTGYQVALTIEDVNKLNTIWYWKAGMVKAEMKVGSEGKRINSGMIIQSSISFSDNGRYIQFGLRPRSETYKPSPDAIQLDIWRSQDTVLQSALPSKLKEAKPFKAVLNVENNQLIQLENQFEILHKMQGDYAIIKKKSSLFFGDRYWEKGYDEDSNWVVYLRDGSRKLLLTKDGGPGGWFSPGGKYWVYFDSKKGFHYYCYNLQTGESKDISPNINDSELGFHDQYFRSSKLQAGSPGIAGWLESDRGILVYDTYDIWLLDLNGKTAARNITQAYGKKNNIQFGIKDNYRFPEELPIKENELLTLTAFNINSKYNGFYRTSLTNSKQPELLFMGPCFFQSSGSIPGLTTDNGMSSQKATNADVWIVKHQTATDARNYFLTKDFKVFKRLTDHQPQNKYNWLTSELISFNQLDGTESHAILYKPENFDPTKKYPVIISFYAQLSDRLYQYLAPSYITMPNIFDNPAWLVSHGYLVVMPDIYFTEGQWGPSTVNTIDGVARYLKTLRYIDTTRLGATGHSNSGRFGYYLLTHSTSFAAMSVGAGITNIISTALRLRSGNGESLLSYGEETSYGAALGNLWDHKSTWLDHASVLNADKVSAPLLLFHNTDDGAFAAGNALDMFISLRRLSKPVWWLNYEAEGHSLSKLKDQRDFTIRYTQYFDHYLMRAPTPIWMSSGIRGKQMQAESAYELNRNSSYLNN